MVLDLEQDYVYEECCDKPNIVEKNGRIICTNCATDLGSAIISVEKRCYDELERSSRKQNEVVSSHIGNRTTLNPKGDTSRFGPKQAYHFIKLDRINRSLRGSIERNFWEAKPKLKTICNVLSIPDFVEALTWKIYSKSVEIKLTQGRSITGILSASLSISLHHHKSGILNSEIYKFFDVSEKDFNHCVRLISLKVLPLVGIKYSSTDTETLIIRIANEFKLPMDMQKECIELLRKVKKFGGKVGNSPSGLASSIIYSICLKDKRFNTITQAKVSRSADITEVTLRTYCRKMKKVLPEEIIIKKSGRTRLEI